MQNICLFLFSFWWPALSLALHGVFCLGPKLQICGTLWNNMQGCLPSVPMCLMPVYFIQMFWQFLKWNCASDFNLALKFVCCCSCIFRVFPDLTFVHWQHEVGRLWWLEDNLRCFSPLFRIFCLLFWIDNGLVSIDWTVIFWEGCSPSGQVGLFVVGFSWVDFYWLNCYFSVGLLLLWTSWAYALSPVL